MKFLIIFSVITFTACSTVRAPSLNMLKKRADYRDINHIESSLNSIENPLLVPSRTHPMVADIWVHPHEMPTGDYFRGGWIRTIVTRSRWFVDKKSQSLLIKKKPKKKRSYRDML